MFNVPGSNIVEEWMSFFVLVPIIIVVALMIGWFIKTKAGERTGNFFHKLLLVVTYPLYKIRSKLPHKGQSVFDNLLLVLYIVGAGLLVMYAAN